MHGQCACQHGAWERRRWTCAAVEGRTAWEAMLSAYFVVGFWARGDLFIELLYAHTIGTLLCRAVSGRANIQHF